MPYIKVEPTGCCERKGLVQVRFCMYLDENDYGYEEHHVLVPIIPEEGYTGKVDELGQPVDQKDYDNWHDSLPTEWRTNPFHNHFVQVEPDITDEVLMDIGEAYLNESYIKWATSEKIDPKNHKSVKQFSKLEVEARVEDIKTKTLIRSISWLL